MTTRRTFLAATGMASLVTLPAFARGTARAHDQATFTRQVTALETGVGGRLGVAVIDAQDGAMLGYRAEERFPMCSTFKFLAAAVLRRVDMGQERLDRRIVFGRDALITWSPVTEKHVGGQGMTVGQLCEAIMTISDNTAANLLLDSLGGPAAITSFVRGSGDAFTRLDRNEPTLNEALDGDPRDTTTPAAMAGSLQRIVAGDVLKPASRAQMIAWLRANKTGDKRVRASLPPGWHAGDRTGAGAFGTANTIGAIWRPQGKPLLFAIYLTQNKASNEQRDAVHAALGKLIAQTFA